MRLTYLFVIMVLIALFTGCINNTNDNQLLNNTNDTINSRNNTIENSSVQFNVSATVVINQTYNKGEIIEAGFVIDKDAWCLTSTFLYKPENSTWNHIYTEPWTDPFVVYSVALPEPELMKANTSNIIFSWNSSNEYINFFSSIESQPGAYKLDVMYECRENSSSNYTSGVIPKIFYLNGNKVLESQTITSDAIDINITENSSDVIFKIRNDLDYTIKYLNSCTTPTKLEYLNPETNKWEEKFMDISECKVYVEPQKINLNSGEIIEISWNKKINTCPACAALMISPALPGKYRIIFDYTLQPDYMGTPIDLVAMKEFEL